MRLALAFVKQATKGALQTRALPSDGLFAPSAFLKGHGLGFLRSTPPTPILVGSER
jgi:hypothetical protein